MSARRNPRTAPERTEPSLGLRAAQKEFTRRHLLDAAVAIFEERGFSATTVEDIVARAGTSRATFYAHFDNKIHVVTALGDSLAVEILDYYRRLDDALAHGSEDTLRAWFEYALGWWDAHGKMLPTWEEAAANDPDYAARAQAHLERIPEAMPQYVASWPKPQRAEARLRILLFVAQLERAFYRWPPAKMKASERRTLVDVLTSIWSPALRPGPGAPS